MRTMLGRTLLLCSLLAIAASAQPAPAWAAAEGNANFFLGFKQLDDDDWEPLDDQGVFGAELSFGKEGWPVMIAVDLMFSGAEEEEGAFDLTGATSELGLGVRKIWNQSGVQPFIGGGVAVVGAALEIEGPGGADTDDDDNGLGLWVGGGVFWRLGSRFNLGVSLRYSAAEVEILDTDVEAGGISGGLLLGWGWPAR